MPNERYSDAQLRLMAEAAKALEPVMAECGYRDLLHGKWALLMDDIRQEHAMRDVERSKMFVPPRVQLFNLMRWNIMRGWGFSDDDVTEIAGDIPPDPPAPEVGKLQLTARVLEIALPDAPDGTPGHRRTFDELWSIVVAEQGGRPCHLFELATMFKLKDGSKDAATTLELAPGTEHRPGLRWRTIDFGHGWPNPNPEGRSPCGISPRHLPREAERPHAGVLSAAAHFPLWLTRMDGLHVPFVWIAGYELKGVPHDLGKIGLARVVHHPRLVRSDSRPFLYMGWDHSSFEDHAVPLYVESKTDP